MPESVPITPGTGANVAVRKNETAVEQLVADIPAEEKLELIRALLAGTLTVGGTVGVSGSLASPVPVRLSTGSEGIGTTGGRLQVADGGVALGVKAEALGTEGEAEATANGNVIGLLKRLRKLLEGTGSLILATGSNLIGKVQLEPRTGGGLESKGIVSAAGLNATVVKNAAGQLYGYELFNTTAAARYVKFYNKATAPAVATDTPVIRVLLPPGGGVAVESPHGRIFSAGISFVTTKGPTDANAEEVAANDLLINVYFK